MTKVAWLVGCLAAAACGGGAGGVKSPDAATSGGAPDAHEGAPDAAAAGGGPDAATSGGANDAHEGAPDAAVSGGAPDAAVSGGGPDAAVSGGAPDAGSGAPSWDLANPAAGEWPMFKRRLDHTGVVPPAEMSGKITAGTLCKKWERQLTGENRGASGPLIAKIDGTWTVLMSVAGPKVGADPGPGRIYALDGANDGVPLWTPPFTELPDGAFADNYAPLVADIDADGKREMVVVSNNKNKAFAIRTEDEGAGHLAGSIQWTFTMDQAAAMSETGPAAANLDPSDDQLEVVFGSDSGSDEAAIFYAVGGATGHAKGRFVSQRRWDRDMGCTQENKIDSSSPAIADVNGLTVFVGSWDGSFYGLEWRGGDAPGLYERWRYDLPTEAALDCSIRKVRSSPAIAALAPGGPLAAVFGSMAQVGGDDYTTAKLHIVAANGLTAIDTFDIDDWKSSPSIGDLVPGDGGKLEIAGGRVGGFYAAGATGPVWQRDCKPQLGGDGCPGGLGPPPYGNRSSPALADIDGDGKLDIIVGVEGEANPGLVVLDAATGDVKWRFDSDPVTSSPAVGDIDGDGELEIVFFTLSGKAIALDSSCP